MNSDVRPKYTGIALPTGSATTNLFDSTVAFKTGNPLQTLEFRRLRTSIINDQACTLKPSASDDRGVTWYRVLADIVLAAPTTNTENVNDFIIEQYRDFKVDVTNGGTNQGTFHVNMVLSGQRGAVT